jgi:hypothetical protein
MTDARRWPRMLRRAHLTRLVSSLLTALLALALPLTAVANDVAEATSTYTYSSNMKPHGYSARVLPESGPGSGVFNSDLAFWGNYAIHGHYAGFRIIDVTDATNPVEIVNWEECAGPTSTQGNQGDIVIWRDIVVRSWNSPAPAAGSQCGDWPMSAGQEGVHVIDISDPTNPQVVAFVDTECGSHTVTAVPDAANDRLLVYSSASAAACRGIDIIEVPLDDPAGASFLRFEPSGEAPALPNELVVDPPSAAAGTYAASGANFGPDPTPAGISGAFSVVDAAFNADFPAALPSEGCGTLIGFPAGAIALIDRGTCPFVTKVANAQAAGAAAAVVINNVAGAPITMGGTDPTITIPSVMVSQSDGAAIKVGLPANGTVREAVTGARRCHDTAVILGDVMKAACAGGNGLTLWSIGGPDGGSLDDPEFLWSRSFAGVSIGKSASFTWDGRYIVFGHEPGGGSQAQCQATSPDVNRTLFFVDTETGDTAGEFIHPRPQTATENCTWRLFNVMPTNKRYLLVSGNYQSGVSVVDFTDPAAAAEIAFADPAPLSDTTIVIGGDWAAYWYNGHIYESDIRRGVIIWQLTGPSAAGAMAFDHLNPQTQEISFPLQQVGGGAPPGPPPGVPPGPPAGVPPGPPGN